MKRFMKNILIIAIITAFTVMFMSCKSGGTAAEEEQPVEEQEKEEEKSIQRGPEIVEDEVVHACYPFLLRQSASACCRNRLTMATVTSPLVLVLVLDPGEEYEREYE